MAPYLQSSAKTPSRDQTSATLDEMGDSNRILSASFARTETRWINCLRVAVLSVLLLTAILISTGVYFYTRNEERSGFIAHFEDSAHQVLNSFHDMVERNIGAAASMSTTITSYAIDKNLSFPFVTLPDFALRGSHARIQSGSLILHYFPLVTDDNREEWEEYAYQNRHHIDEAFEEDEYFRTKQDMEIGEDRNERYLQEETSQRNMTVLQDGSSYHPRIWNNGALDRSKAGDEPEGSGPYLPAWQRR